MKNLVLKPHILLLLGALLVGLWGLLMTSRNSTSTADIQLYDTYYVIAAWLFFLVITGILIVFALYYYMLLPGRVSKIYPALAWLHVALTLPFFLLATYLFFPWAAFPRDPSFYFNSYRKYMDYLSLSFVFFLAGQLIFVVSLFLWVSQFIHRMLKP